MKLLVYALILVFLCPARAGNHLVTVCPDDFSHRDDCVPLHQLLSNSSLIKSNTTIKFVNATFKLKSDAIISIANVSNIILDTAGTHRANVSCIGNNSGLLFHNVSGLTVQNMNFVDCGANQNLGTQFALALTETANIVLDNVTFKRGKGCGVFAANIYGNLFISNVLFTYIQGTGFCLQYSWISFPLYPSIYGQPNITISNSKFSSISCHSDIACAIDAALNQQHFPLKLYVVDVTVTNITHGYDTSDISVQSNTPLFNHIVFENFNRENNSVGMTDSDSGYGGSDFSYRYDGPETTQNVTVIEIINSSFVNNIYQFSEDYTDNLLADEALYCGINFFTDVSKPHRISILNTTISNNTGNYGAAICSDFGSTDILIYFEVVTSVFANNTIFFSDYYKKGAVSLKNVFSIRVFSCSFLNNTGTGLLIENSRISFSGLNVFRGNKAYNGGGLGLYWSSSVKFEDYARLIFENNLAENVGGGLYVKRTEEVRYYEMGKNPCFIEAYGNGVALVFNNNSAKIAGNDLYGGKLYMCTVKEDPGWLVLTDLVSSPYNYTIEVTSDPLRVCDCSSSSSQDCLNFARTINAIQTYPGRMFDLSIVAVGQLINKIRYLSGISSAIYASLLPQTSTGMITGRIPEAMLIQNGERTCSNISYRINSKKRNEVMVLTVSNDMIEQYLVALWQDDHSLWIPHIIKVLMHGLVVPVYVEIHFHHCPVGFELSPDGACGCSTALKEFVIDCSIDTMLIQRKPSYWIAPKNYSEQHNNASALYLTHRHCPFDYCRNGTFQFSLEDADAQCSHNHSGILCGACKPGYSLILGGTECRQCTDIYLLLLIPFGLAGLGLIVFLSLTDMTVASGTINGLLFYANILTDNKATFFPPAAAESFPSVFIAWLDLDFGIKSCFYDGLDAYAFTWLQLSFPIYIWVLAFVTIIACRHVSFMSKLCGTNIVPVLATLFLLSYTKLLNTITDSLSCTVVDVSNGEKLLVWLKDGNIPYLQGKHIALFLVNFVFLLILLAYTLSIVLGPWLQRKTQYRVFCWVLKLKPLFDAYFGPLKDQHRYWTGVLLLSRMVLCLASAVNILGDDSINLLAIITINFLLVVILWQSGSVYKSYSLSILDSFFIINLGILASVTLFNKLSSGGSQYVAIYVSTGSACAVFCVILLYHCFRSLRKCFARRQEPHHLLADGTPNEEDSDDDMLDAIDANRKIK